MIPDALVPAAMHPDAVAYCSPNSKYRQQCTCRDFAVSSVGTQYLAKRWGINATATVLSELVH